MSECIEFTYVRVIMNVFSRNVFSMKLCLFTGLTGFDFILDYDEWIDCGYLPMRSAPDLKLTT